MPVSVFFHCFANYTLAELAYLNFCKYLVLLIHLQQNRIQIKVGTGGLEGGLEKCGFA